MIQPVYLLVDPRGWNGSPSPLDPEMVNAILQARLQPTLPVEVYARSVDEAWFRNLPQDEALVIVLMTRPLAPGWQNVVSAWLRSTHTLYAIYLDGVDPGDIRALASLTAAQPVARAPYRLAQSNAAGLENAMAWVVGILQKTAELAPALPPIRVAPARWRHLPSNRQDEFFYPEDFTTSLQGAAGYRLTTASHRGKTHAHQGTFREDAVSITATTHWNIMAVADGAGTADLARVGSNLAVSRATAAMADSMPAVPAAEDVGRAIWAGLKAAYQAVKGFANGRSISMSDLNTTLQLLIHWPQDKGCLLGVAHVGDGIVTAEMLDGQYYLLTDPDTDPDDSSRTLFLTSGPLKQWMERTRVYQFDEPLDIVALMTDGLSGDLEPYAELLHTNLFEMLRNRVLCYPLPQRESALLSMISYDRRGSFDDRTLAVLSKG